MLRLFHSIFGAEQAASRYPDALVEAAIERAVDGTDPWLRGLSGYRRKLRPAVLKAMDHVVNLVDNLGDVLELSRQNYDVDPQLKLFFISQEQMLRLLASDSVLTAWQQASNRTTQPSWALLTMQCEQRRTFGAALQGETVVRNVPQVTVSMTDHRLIDPATDIAETRRQLKRRAFDHLLTMALARLAAVRDVREDLARHRTLLQSKLNYLQRGDWGFSGSSRDLPPPVAELQQQIDLIESQFSDVGGDDRYLEKNLEILIDALTNAQHQLWAQPLSLIVDRMGIRRSQTSDDAPELTLMELHNAAGRRLIARLVMVPS
jgi:hypothetical protein